MVGDITILDVYRFLVFIFVCTLAATPILIFQKKYNWSGFRGRGASRFFAIVISFLVLALYYAILKLLGL
jgi:hypothetical protein